MEKGNAVSHTPLVRDVPDHYQNIAASYEGAVFYDPDSPYHAWLVHRTQALLRLGPRERLVDIGGGAGGFTSRLRELAGSGVSALVVEPSAGLRATAAGRAGIEVNAQDALSFAGSAGWSADCVLLKEVIHHLPLPELATFFAHLRERLSEGGRILTITRPRKPDLPLFAAAREAWSKAQPPASELVDAQRRAGLAVEEHESTHDLELTRDAWIAAVRARCWSTFSEFSDAELERGVRELEATLPPGRLILRDRLIFLLARRGD